MEIEIVIDNNMERKHCLCYSYEDAINVLYNLKIQQVKSRPMASRCHKCVYENTCSNIDIDGNCSGYKLDPPDGGYYG